MAMRDVGDNMTGDDPRAQSVQLLRTLADLSLDTGIGLHTWKRDRHRLPHARRLQTTFVA
jgi:hypothetical protein